MRRAGETPSRAALGLAPVAIVATDLTWRVTVWSNGAELLFGWTQDEVLGGQNPLEPAVRRALTELVQERVLAGETVHETGFELPRKDGSFVAVDFSVAAVPGSAGETIGLVGYYSGANAQRASDARAALILEQMGDAFVSFDHEWRFTYVNQKAAELFGREPRELLGKSYLEAYPEAAGSSFRGAYERAYTEQRPMYLEHYELWDRWFENRIYPVPDGLAIFFTEITERKRNEAELHRRSREIAAHHEVALAILRESALQSVLETVVEHAALLVDAPIAGFFLVDESTGTLTPAAAFGDKSRYRDQPSGRGEGVIGRVAVSGETLVVNDYPAWPGAVEPDLGLTAALGIPLSDEGRVIGVLAIGLTREGSRFEQDDVELLERFAGLTELAIATTRKNERLRLQTAMLDHAHVFARSPDGTIFDWNHGAEYLYGWTRDEAIGRISHELLHTEFSQPLAEIEQTVDRDAAWEGELVQTRKDGSRIVVTSHWTLHRDAEGKPVALLEVHTDVTDLRAAERAQRLQSERLAALGEIDRSVLAACSEREIVTTPLARVRELTECKRVAVILLDPDSDRLVTVATADERGVETTRQRAEVPRAEATLWADLEQGTTLTGDLRDLGGASPIVAEALAEDLRVYLAVPIRGEEQPAGMLTLLWGDEITAVPPLAVEIAEEIAEHLAVALAHVRTLSDLRRLTGELERRVLERTEEAQAARAEAEQANLAKSEFLSRMSHELRTPLNAVLGFGQLLEMDGLEGEHAESVSHILRAGRHLLSLIEEVLDISRIEARTLALSIEPVALDEVLIQSLDLIRPLAADREIQLPSLPEAAACWVRADRQRVLQVLLNLFSNAVKYGRAGGEVTLDCEEPRPGQVRVTVGDTGPGIAPSDLERAFIPFERLETAAQIEGTGLGLSLAKSLTEAMGGTIGASSTPGEGSAFWIELAAAEEPLLAAGIDDAPPANGEGTPCTVLYIEDNLSNLRLVERILGRLPGSTVVPAMQGRIGLELARTRRPDVILLDLHLPDLAGEDVLRSLLEEPATCDIPVIVISAEARPGEIRRLLQCGAQDYVTKPIEPTRLLTAVGRAVAGR